MFSSSEIAFFHEFLALHTTSALRQNSHTINGMNQLYHVFSDMLILQHRLIVTIEFGIKVFENLFTFKGFSAVRNVFLCTSCFLLFLIKVFE